jgi:hypothetical protein
MVLIPFLQEKVGVFFHDLPDLPEFSRIITHCPF